MSIQLYRTFVSKLCPHQPPTSMISPTIRCKFDVHVHICLYTGVVQDYCQLETFAPQCMKNEVIVIEQATYGRHKIGKCITAEESILVNDERYFGCHANVAAQMNAKCSGKRQCEVRIPDADLERTRSCLPGLQMFLEVSFSCIEGIPILCS